MPSDDDQRYANPYQHDCDVQKRQVGNAQAESARTDKNAFELTTVPLALLSHTL